MIASVKNIVLEGKHQKPILADLFYTKNEKQKPLVIFCHGYKGFKDWGAWDLVAESFAKAGFFFLKFNFSHNGGTVEQPIDFPDLEAFGYNNYIKELDDLESVIDWVTSSSFEYKNQVNNSQITLIGHSRGGGIAILKASEDHRITKLISWASVSDYKNRFPKDEAFELWKKNGVYYIQNGRTKQQMPHYFQFYTSFIDNEDRLTISKAAKKIKIPHLIIHGTDDPTVNIKEAQLLHQWNPESELFLVNGADHVFGAKHPWIEQFLPNDLLYTIEKSIPFAIL
ncbi:alpha/beta fold hydrolase [Aquimarina sp. MMG016]|uniref:alpha/beta hydrolase family protein n=1 Tax=Aquimarina sp. MMG016 TaxID=2822690 RepID=UPI001B3A29E3|nr:alpha/beta fold hydrolase [Aquimarina sp. MMG016]MBQ4819851.1 alpha/beta fold hydrolase [Aquimarina sp. MMG016]